MKIVTVKQNTKEWKLWRGKGLGASDAPAVMGESPWCTPFELWLDKTGLYPRPSPNEYQLSAMRRGQELEPVARKMYEEKTGKEYPSVSATHDNYEFLRASFDGYNEESNTIIEIKCPSKLDHEKAKKGSIPSKYVAQIQQQLLISGARSCLYVSFDGKEGLEVVEIKPDKEYQTVLLDRMIDFWKRVSTQTPPNIDSNDVNKLIEDMTKSLDRVNKVANVLQLITKPEGD